MEERREINNCPDVSSTPDKFSSYSLPDGYGFWVMTRLGFKIKSSPLMELQFVIILGSLSVNELLAGVY